MKQNQLYYEQKNIYYFTSKSSKNLLYSIAAAACINFNNNTVKAAGKISDKHNPSVIKKTLHSLNCITAADTIITGTVTNQNGQPLAGVSITIRGTTKGTVTDASGRF